MAYHFRLLYVFLIILQALSLQAQEVSRGIIAQSDPADKTTWLLNCPQGFILVRQEQTDVKEQISDSLLKITAKAGKLYCNGKKISTDRLRIMPQQGSVSIGSIEYTGPIMIVRKDRCYVLIYLGETSEQAINGSMVSSDSSRSNLSKNEHAIKTSKKKARDCTVRVMLDEKKELRVEPWILQSNQGFIVFDPRENKQKKRIDSTKLVITIKRDNMIYLNNKAFFEGQICIQPREEITSFNGNDYRGPMWIVADAQGARIINCIGLEDYVESVLRTESWPGWPLEVNKVFAIASRTYVIAMVQKAKVSKGLYHVRNTNKHQTYTGGNASDVIKQAVKETEGIFLTYKNQPITAMFDTCCGGVVTAKVDGLDGTKYPYLARTYPCEFCKNCKMYSWRAIYDIHDLEKILRSQNVHVRRLRDVKVTRKDKAGLVQQVTLKGGSHAYHASGKKIYSVLCKEVKSFCFTIDKKGNNIIFKGRGRGHHLGLCQWGAREMVRDGIDFKSVLAFYYPGTQLMRLL